MPSFRTGLHNASRASRWLPAVRSVILGSLLASGGLASESVSMRIIQGKAYESDPVNSFGEIEISRAVATTSPLTVFFSYEPSFPAVPQPGLYGLPLESAGAVADIAPHDPLQTWDFALVYADQRGNPHAYRNAADVDLQYLTASLQAGSLVYSHVIDPSPLGVTDKIAASGGRSQITIPAGDRAVRIRILPYKDVDLKFGELEEAVKFRLLSDNNSGLDYVASDSNYRQVDIIDANITAQIVTLSDTSETTATGGGPASSTPDGVMRIWFDNSDVRGAGAPTLSYSPYAYVTDSRVSGLVARNVEVLLSGTAALGTDYDLFWHMGGGVIPNGTVPESTLPQNDAVNQPFAYRVLSETGTDTHARVCLPSFDSIDVSPAITLPGSFYNLRAVTIAGAAQTGTFPGYRDGANVGHSLQDEVFWGIDMNGNGVVAGTGGAAPTVIGNSITITQVGGGRSRLNLTNAVAFNIAQGARVRVQYETLASVVNTVAGPPAVTTTTLIPTTVTVDVDIDENVIYPQGAVTASVMVDGGAPLLKVGDLFRFSHDETSYYRVTGPTPNPAANSAVNRDANTLAMASVGASNLLLSYISFWPPLQVPITKDGGGATIETEFPEAFDANKRMVINMPALPNREIVNTHLVYTYADLAGTVTTLQFPNGTYGDNDLPLGDWIEYRVAKKQDLEVEGAETVTLTLQPTGATNGYTILNPGVTSVVIADNDSVASVENVNDAAEPSVNGTFRVSFTKAFPRDITVPYTLLSTGLSLPANWAIGTPSAAAPDATDFTMDGLDTITASGFVTLMAGATEVEIRVYPISDGAYEPIENISLQLQPSEDYVLATTTSTSTNASAATMKIIDTLGTITVSGPTPNLVYEAVPLTVPPTVPRPAVWTINLVRRPEIAYRTPDVTANYTWTGGAIKSVDYTTVLSNGTESANTGTVTFDAGDEEESQTVSLTATNDTVDEGDETAVLTLTAGDTYILGATVDGTATIRDDMSPGPSGTITLLGPSPASVYEEDADTTHYPVFTLNLVRNVGRETDAVTVTYQLSGTALLGTDYTTTTTTTTGTVAFPAGTSSATIRITPTDDGLAEADETVVLTVLEGDGYTLGTAFTGTATIIDGAPPAPTGTLSIVVSDPGYIYEDALSATLPVFTVSLDRDPGHELDVVTATARITGSAIFNTDYILVGGPGVTIAPTVVTVVFPANVSVRTFTLSPIADGIDESNERAVFSLNSDASYVRDPSANSAVETIRDGEEPANIPDPSIPGASDDGGGCGMGGGVALILGGLALTALRLRRQR